MNESQKKVVSTINSVINHITDPNVDLQSPARFSYISDVCQTLRDKDILNPDQKEHLDELMADLYSLIRDL